MSDCCVVQPSHPTSLDDEIAALILQLEEIGLFSNQSKGKHAIDQPPDIDIAFASFQTELLDYQKFLTDQQLARSIGAAVNLDGAAITQLTSEEIQCHEDRLFALTTSRADPECEGAALESLVPTDMKMNDWIDIASKSQYAGSVIDDFDEEHSESGPSMSYAEKQGNVLEMLSKPHRCAVCLDNVAGGFTVLLPCKDRYCFECLRKTFKRAITDEELFPVRCCKQPIPLSLVSGHMSQDELSAFTRASIEFSTVDRVYCSNHECGQFIIPENIEAGSHRAVCEACNTFTCGLCKNNFHHGEDCPNDPDMERTRDLAREQGWQTCHGCGSIVVINTGCNHMKCRCGAEFCYECGTRWKNCRCEFADERRMLERAEAIVDRDERFLLPPVERARRVRQVRAELEGNHECEHPGRFQRRFDGCPRRGFRCEMCDARHWKYILQCRHCYINVCEDCRRNRV
ncbi:hypothetical protein ACN47E_005968 [Coniothyrium glycines]